MLKSLIIAVSFFSYTTLSYASNDEVLQPDPAAQTIKHVEISPSLASETANEKVIVPLSLRPLPAPPSQPFKQVDISPTPASGTVKVEINRNDSDKITLKVLKGWTLDLLKCCCNSIDNLDD